MRQAINNALVKEVSTAFLYSNVDVALNVYTAIDGPKEIIVSLDKHGGAPNLGEKLRQILIGVRHGISANSPRRCS